MGQISRIKCDLCGLDVDVDSDKPTLKLDPQRKRSGGLHICLGRPPEKSPTAKCEEDIESFLRTNVLIVDEEEQAPNGRWRIQRFKVTAGPHNAHFLSFQTNDLDEGLKAYWLPWQISEATTVTLGDEANLFFTSELTNCRFCVLDDDPKRPTVAHVAGNLVGSKKRDEAEGTVQFDPQRRARRLSVSQGSDLKPFNKPKIDRLHDYRGQKPGHESSAFIYGLRDQAGNWSFRAQIVKGNMADTGVIKSTTTKNLEILNYCYRI